MKNLFVITLFVTAVATTGCERGNLHKVTGVVTMDGQPISDALITFTPADASGGKVATGKSDDSGRFWMGTMKSEDGVQPGKYKVTVWRPTEPMVPQKTMGEVMAEKYAGGDAGKAGTRAATEARREQIKEGVEKKKRAPTPETYNDIKTTPLTADVPAQTEYTFDLKTKPN